RPWYALSRGHRSCFPTWLTWSSWRFRTWFLQQACNTSSSSISWRLPEFAGHFEDIIRRSAELTQYGQVSSDWSPVFGGLADNMQRIIGVLPESRWEVGCLCILGSQRSMTRM